MAYVKDLEFFSYNTINLEGLRRFNLFILPQENFFKCTRRWECRKIMRERKKNNTYGTENGDTLLMNTKVNQTNKKSKQFCSEVVS